MRQILSRDMAIIISNTEVMMLNHPSTIFTNDDVIVRIGKTETEAKEALLIDEIKKALDINKITYTTKETKVDLLSKLIFDEKVIDDITVKSVIK